MIIKLNNAFIKYIWAINEIIRDKTKSVFSQKYTTPNAYVREDLKSMI